MKDRKYDAVIIGAGQAGMPLAKKISSQGLKVALIEKRQVGGTCINDGCSPTKTLVSSARIAHLVFRAGDYGVRVAGFEIDQKAIKLRKENLVSLFRGGAEKSLKKHENIDIIMGKASFLSEQELLVKRNDHNDLKISGDKVFINTGSHPVIPDIEGLKESPYLTSTSIMELDDTPEHLIIMGGGYIGLEFAQMFRRFGSKVTIVDRAKRLVSKEDEDVCQEVSAVFEEEGINCIFEADVVKVTYNQHFLLSLKTSEGPKELLGSHLLVAVGRAPSSDGIGLENTGIALTPDGHIMTNEFLQTDVPSIYALGDVAGSPPFTHIAYHDAHLAFQNCYEGKQLSKNERLVPYCLFIDPQLGRIGINEQEAKAKGIPYSAAKFLMKHAGRALETDEKRGFFKVLVDPATKKILGASILSIDGGEILAVLQMAMLGGITYDTIATLPIAHPTLAESLNNLMMQLK